MDLVTPNATQISKITLIVIKHLQKFEENFFRLITTFLQESFYLGCLKALDDKLNGISSIFNSIDSHFLIRRMYGLISDLNDPITSKKLTRTPGWTVGNDIFNENARS